MAIYRITVSGHGITQEEWNFTIHVEMVTGQAAILATLAADAVTLAWQGPPTPGSSLQQLYATTTLVDGVVVDELDNAGKNVSQGRANLALAGTAVTEPLPPNVAIAVSLRTATPTRAGRGRFFLPAPVIGNVVNQLLPATPRGQILNAALAMLDHLKDNAAQPVIYHRLSHLGTPIITCDVGNVFDQQGRRRNQLVEARVSGGLT